MTSFTLTLHLIMLARLVVVATIHQRKTSAQRAETLKKREVGSPSVAMVHPSLLQMRWRNTRKRSICSPPSRPSLNAGVAVNTLSTTPKASQPILLAARASAEAQVGLIAFTVALHPYRDSLVLMTMTESALLSTTSRNTSLFSQKTKRNTRNANAL